MSIISNKRPAYTIPEHPIIIPIAQPRHFVGVGALVMMVIVPLTPARDFEIGAFQNRSWPMFGGSPGRNMVNPLERNLPADWCVQEGKLKNIKWMADLGNKTFGSCVVAHGKVFVATNNAKPRDPNVKGHQAVLMAFRETDGTFLWQITHDYPDWFHPLTSTLALPSTPAVIGHSLYYVTPACEIICADSDDGKINWRYDMIKELKVVPCPGYCPQCGPGLASPLVVGDLVFVVTGNGINDDDELVSPRAPSFVALHKKTGKLAWQSNLPGENIIEGQWSSPTFANVNGIPQVIFAGGDCVIYSLDPETGRLLWKCDCLPTRKKKGGREIDNYIVGTPVVLGDKLYVGLGHAPHRPWRNGSSYFLCLDITKRDEVSLKSYDATSALNKGSALVWAFGGPIEPRPDKGHRVYFGSTPGTAAVHGGLVYITEEYGYLHCLDAATGRRVWKYDLEASLMGSPYWVDGRVFVGTEAGELLVFAHGRTAKLLARIDMEEMIHTTPVAVNGTLYVATTSKLYAISSR